MEKFINYFEHISPSHRAIILVSGITFFWILEYALPLFHFDYRKFRHAWPNFFFTLTTIIVNFLMAFILLKTSDWTVSNGFGLLQWLNWPLWAEVITGLLIMDLIGAYWSHWAEHKVKALWMFHIIHHTDDCVDTTTANRHHPGESIIRFFFTTLGVLLLGCPIGIIMLYQSISVILSQFNHANIQLPKAVDDAISWLIVSPDMHKVHHHYAQPYTDTNYGNIFSFWDRLFGTFAKLGDKDIIYGVDTYPDVDSETDVGKLLKLPFEGYRPPTPTGTQTRLDSGS